MEPTSKRARTGPGDRAGSAGHGARRRPVPSHPWDGYLSGPENELAMAAAQALARGEREGISPLVVHGPSGVGKSRLLAGLVAERLRRQPGSAVAHLDAETFAAACVEAAGEPGVGGWSALRGRFRAVDLFVLEDLEGLERAPWLATSWRTRSMRSRPRARAWRSRRGPRPGRGRDWGGRPGWSTACWGAWRPGSIRPGSPRAAATSSSAPAARAGAPGRGGRDDRPGRRRLPHPRRLDRPAGLGSPAQSPARGPGRRLKARQSRRPRCRRTCSIRRRSPPSWPRKPLLAEPTVTIDAIARAVADRFGVRLAVLRGPSRRASVVEARHLAMHLARLHSGSSFAAIGTYFGGRDPATVRHACKAAVVRLDADPALAAAVATLGRGWQKSEA